MGESPFSLPTAKWESRRYDTVALLAGPVEKAAANRLVTFLARRVATAALDEFFWKRFRVL
jgi:hypothetical protein